MIHARIALGLLAFTALPAFAMDAEKSAIASNTSATAALDFTSAYIFRGVTVNKRAAVQPTLKVQIDKFTIGGWGSFAMDAEEGETKQEVDGFASFDIPISIVTLSLGYTEYTYPNSDYDNDQEIMAKVSVATILNPSLGIYHGVGGAIVNNNYYELGLKQEVFAHSGFSAGLGAVLGYIDSETGEDGFSHLTLSAAAAYNILTASVNYVVETDDTVNDLTNQQPFFVMAGTSFTF